MWLERMVGVVFFLLYGDQRELHVLTHSVPTRRSSDLASGAEAQPEGQVVVVGAGREQVERAVEGSGAVIAVQEQQLGTGHAVAQAHDALAGFAGDILILYGDVPLVRAETLRSMLDRLNWGDEPRAVEIGRAHV